jgi:hypothetical protein
MYDSQKFIKLVEYSKKGCDSIVAVLSMIVMMMILIISHAEMVNLTNENVPTLLFYNISSL